MSPTNAPTWKSVSVRSRSWSNRDVGASLATAERVIREQGAITFALYSSNPVVVQHAEEAALRVGVALSINLTAGVFVDQSAAYSDFHATGANPAANACLTDSAFVANRFFVVQSRRHIE